MDSEKFQRSCEKLKEHYIMLKKKRRRSVLVSDVKSLDTKTTPPVVPPQVKCSARTLEGRQCTFNATHGHFCKKHFSMV